MSHILHIDTSPRGERSISRTLTKEFISKWLQAHPQDTTTYRDVGQFPLPLLNEAWIAGAFSKASTLPPELTEALRISDELIDELLAADRYIFGIPMYNFSVPAHFKAYIDQIVRVNRTFQPPQEGLLTGKKMLVITTRGSSYAGGSELASYDFHEPYLRTVFGYIGVTDMTFLYAERLNEGEDARQQSLMQVRRVMQQTVKTW